MLKTDKGLRPRIYKELLPIKKMRTVTPWKNGQRVWTIDREETPKAHMHEKKSPKSLAIIQKQIRTRQHFTSIGLGKTRKAR